MRFAIILLLLAGCARPQRKPAALTFMPAVEFGVRLGSTAGDNFTAKWVSPYGEVWVPEYSTNRTHWFRCQNETAFPDGAHYTETGLHWTTNFFVRLVRLTNVITN